MQELEFKADFWSAVKRKNIVDLLEIIFTETGHPEAAKICGETNRFTSASVDRMISAIAKDIDTEEVEIEEEEDTDVEEPRLTIGEIRDLCATGKKKNIKKAAAAFERQFKPDYPEYDEYRKIIKKAKKALKNDK
jgi:hypothetical protein